MQIQTKNATNNAAILAKAIIEDSPAVQEDDLTAQVKDILAKQYKDNPTLLAEKLQKLASVLSEDTNVPYKPINNMEQPTVYKTMNGLPSLNYSIKVQGRLCQLQFKLGILEVMDRDLDEAIKADIAKRPMLSGLFRVAPMSSEIAAYLLAQQKIEKAKQAVSSGISSAQVNKVHDIQTLMNGVGNNDFTLAGTQ